MWYPSSNRDETRYEDPDLFDVTRNPEHQAFGAGGRHFCLGTALARLELRILIEETLSRFPRMEIAGAPSYVESPFANQLKTLPVRLAPVAFRARSSLDHCVRDCSRSCPLHRTAWRVMPTSSRPSSRRWRISGSISNGAPARAARIADLLRAQVHLALAGGGQRAAVLVVEHDRQQPDLGAVGVEDVGEARRDDRLEAVVLQPPRRVLARGAAAEVLARDEDRVGRQVPAGLLGPVVEQELAEAACARPA